MNKKIKNALNTVLPNRNINYFIISIIVLGIISGSIFITIINNTDKEIVIEQIKLFFNNVNTNSINNGLALKNSLIINYTFIILMWVLGLSLIGIFVNVILVYLKGFIIGFSISAIILTYGAKGILSAFLYAFPHLLISILSIMLISTYTILVSKYMLGLIFKKISTTNSPFRKYTIVLGISSILVLISSLLEVFLFPAFIKIIIKLYI